PDFSPRPWRRCMCLQARRGPPSPARVVATARWGGLQAEKAERGGGVDPVGRIESIEEDLEGPPPTPAVDQRPGPDAAISGIAHLLVSEGEPERVLEAVADALAELVPYDTLSLYEADPPLRVLRPVLVRDLYAEEILALGPRAYGVGIVGIAAETESPLLVNDVHLDPRSL